MRGSAPSLDHRLIIMNELMVVVVVVHLIWARRWRGRATPSLPKFISAA
jgi:hypothetical protein